MTSTAQGRAVLVSHVSRFFQNACTMRCDIRVIVASILIRSYKMLCAKQGNNVMKYLKIIVGLGLIPLGVFAGSYAIFDGGNEDFFAAILGGLRCFIL